MRGNKSSNKDIPENNSKRKSDKKISETGQQHNTRSTSLHASSVFLPNANP